MSDLDDIIVRDADQSFKRGIPAVPTPDWGIQNYKAKTPTPNISDKVGHASSSTDQTQKKLPVKRPFNMINTPSTCSHSGSTGKEMPKKPASIRTDVIANTSTSLTRLIGDMTSTHSFSTPLYKGVNPHTSMVAATPASASVVNQAINSIKLQNCVSTVSLGCQLNLLDVYCRTRYTEYNPQKFQGVVMKLLEPRATALIFKSGKIVCTGARNEYDSYIAARKFGRIIEKLGFPTKFLDFKIQNFCATADLKFPVRLDALQHAHGQFASYEPELFPGLVYRMVRPRVVLLIFVNGKVVFTGGKTRNDITEALEIIYPVLRAHSNDINIERDEHKCQNKTGHAICEDNTSN